MNPTTAHRLLGPLRARPTGESRWIAKCPSHEDRSPSLSIRQASDGRFLIHCFAGCSIEAVMSAAGLDWGDLFPDRPRYHRAPLRPPREDPERERLRELRRWRDRAASVLRDGIHDRHQVVKLARRLWPDGRREQAWSCLSFAYVRLGRDEWVLDLLESRNPADWNRARDFILRGSK